MNMAIIVGTVKGEYDLRYTPNGLAIGKFTVEIPYETQDGPQTSEVDVTMLGDRAEEAAEIIEPNKYVIVTGRLNTRTYTTEKGKYRITELRGTQITSIKT